MIHPGSSGSLSDEIILSKEISQRLLIEFLNLSLLSKAVRVSLPTLMNYAPSTTS